MYIYIYICIYTYYTVGQWFYPHHLFIVSQNYAP